MQYMQKAIAVVIRATIKKCPFSAVQSEAQHENHIDIKMHEIYYHARASEIFSVRNIRHFHGYYIPKSPTAQRITKNPVYLLNATHPAKPQRVIKTSAHTGIFIFVSSMPNEI